MADGEVDIEFPTAAWRLPEKLLADPEPEHARLISAAGGSPGAGTFSGQR
jgi:hypothetical protein